MSDAEKTREQLQTELAELRQQRVREEAIERIRVEVLAMRSSEDLLQVVLVAFQEFRRLEKETVAGAFFFVDEAKGCILWYTAMENPRQYGVSWTSPNLREIDETTAIFALEVPITEDWAEDLERWREGKTWSVVRSAEENRAVMQQFFELMGFDRLPSIFEREGWGSTNVPFEYGWAGIHHRPNDPGHIIRTEGWTEALSLGYLRNLDFQRLEEQNRALEEALHQLRETQTQLVMQEKMASLGDLVSGVAHEINNPVGVVNSAADVAQRCAARIGDGEVAKPLALLKANLDAVLEAGGRIDTIVKSLKNFARLDEAEFQTVDLHEGIDSALTLLESQLGGRIIIARDYGEIQPIYCSPGQLNQVFMHLLRNAIAAIEGTGRITIRTCETADGVRVLIRDTGRGIPAEQLARIFDFDFRATDQRVKMGFGLSTDYRIIQDHQGEIKVESEMGEGTEVTIDLPMRAGDPGSV